MKAYSYKPKGVVTAVFSDGAATISSCGSPPARPCTGRLSCSAGADGEDSDPADDGTARFRVSVTLARRQMAGEKVQLRLQLEDYDNVLTRPVLVPIGRGLVQNVFVLVHDQTEIPLGEVGVINLAWKLVSDGPGVDPGREPEPEPEEEPEREEEPQPQPEGEPELQPEPQPEMEADLEQEPEPEAMDYDELGNDANDDQNAAEADMPEPGRDRHRSSSGSGAEQPAWRVPLMGALGAHHQRLYRGGDPERRRAPPPPAERRERRRRRLEMVRWSGRPLAVYVIEVLVYDRRLRGAQRPPVRFPVDRWLRGPVYRLSPLDCSLPQEVEDPSQVTLRQAELLYKADTYGYRPLRFDGAPIEVPDIPDEEKFYNMHEAFHTAREGVVEMWSDFADSEDKWTCFSEMERTFRPSALETNIANVWATDEWFGNQRLAGPDSFLITLCTKIPDKLGVDDAMLRPFLCGLTLNEALQRRRMFIVDLEILDGLQAIPGSEICAPVALFFLNGSGDLVPVAIQLHQNKGPDNPVFLPSDDVCLWVTAKMFYNCSEAQHHHLWLLAVPLLLLESLTVAVHRALSPSHPVFRLLAPYLHRRLEGANLARRHLLTAAGWLDRCGQLTPDSRRQLIARILERWRLDRDGVVPRQVAARGVAEPSVLPHYPYRDDATALHAAIERYVRASLRAVYDDERRLDGDWELFQWRRELGNTEQAGGCRINGVRGDCIVGFYRLDEVVDVVTAIISTCSVGHAAASRSAFAQYSLPANYPLRLLGRPPRSKELLPDMLSDMVALMSGPRAARETAALARLLTSMSPNVVREYSSRHLWLPAAVEAEEEMWEEMKRVAEEGDKRNAEARFPYRCLTASCDEIMYEGMWS
ncbi:polyunsaturated fatty acid lipoxygenase ALOX8-like [Amphibalanus amphitrite]|uniref:polyunsaturated fatty acid lipoxygenase ALOX8-like n=1 Tax=Amphibalanus amphitrite TaxID=1232801 RepID=UPI001C9112EA|nr:polyunsaturated fatty acid lipoxygenase ALOX8-like [Amphibalanus amphitrite]